MDSETICLVSLNAYHRIYPQSFFGRKIKRDEIEHAKNSLVFNAFSKLLDFAKAEGDYILILKLIEKDVDRACEVVITGKTDKIPEDLEKIRKGIGKEKIKEFEGYFREEKKGI